MKPDKYTALQLERALRKTFDQMSQRTYEKTIKGKHNFTDVTEEDWSDCSFSFDNIIKMTIKNLNETN